MMPLLLSRKGVGVGGGGGCSPYAISVSRRCQGACTYHKVRQWPASYCTRSINNSVNRSFARCIPCSSSHHHSHLSIPHSLNPTFWNSIKQPFTQSATQTTTPCNSPIFSFGLIRFQHHTYILISQLPGLRKNRLMQIRLNVRTSDNKGYKSEQMN